MNKKTRVGLIADNYFNKDVTKNIKVQLDVISGLKPLALSQTDGKGINTTINRTADIIEYNLAIDKAFTKKRIDVDVKNALIDENDVNRYIYIGHIESNISKTSFVVYYDSNYKDILIIPDLESIIPIEGTTVNIENRTFNIECRVINSSVPHMQNTVSNDVTYPINESIISAFPTPLNIPGISVYTFMMRNLYNQAKVNNSGFMLEGGNRYIEGSYNETIELIGFGSTDNLFGQNVKHTSFMLRRFKENEYTIEYIGDQVLDDLLVALI